ncbi:MAG: L-fucose/L-arabinose isomerase family protein [Acutalibacteraceae bacterium]
MAKRKIRLGVVCLTRNTFDFKAAEEIYRGILAKLGAREDLELAAYPDPVMEVPQAVEAGEFLRREGAEAIAVVSGTFHLGGLVLEIKKRCDKPLLLWGLPELPYNGGKIRLNSVCGVNLDAANLFKSGYKDYAYKVSSDIDEDWLDAVRMISALREGRIGVLGSRAHGFYNVGVDELALYRKYGCSVEYCELKDAYSFPAEVKDVEKYLERVEKQFDGSAVTDVQKKKVAELCASFKAFYKAKNFSAVAVRCWPEFAAGFGIAPCASMSLLQDDGMIFACEGDVDCALTMLCHRAAGADTPFMADISQVNEDENTALMWHCGVAPRSLCDGSCAATLDTYFAGGKGVTAGFVMKRGRVEIARLDSVNGKYRLYTETGEAVPMEKLLTGTYAKVKFDRPAQEVMDRVILNGLAHHVSMVYGDFGRAFRIFAALTDTETI